MPKFNAYQLRKWSVLVRFRDRTCQVCGSRESLQAHHIFDKSYHPELAYELSNGIALCGNDEKTGNHCHSFYHNAFMGGTRYKCTLRDWHKFTRLVNWSKEHERLSDN